MAAEIRNHELNGYNLKIYDVDYSDFSNYYRTIAENANDYWCGFINILSRLNGGVIKGRFADKIEEVVQEFGTYPGEYILEIVNAIAKNMDSYIEAIDSADGSIY
jgi:hypothetical protein